MLTARYRSRCRLSAMFLLTLFCPAWGSAADKEAALVRARIGSTTYVAPAHFHSPIINGQSALDALEVEVWIPEFMPFTHDDSRRRRTLSDQKRTLKINVSPYNAKDRRNTPESHWSFLVGIGDIDLSEGVDGDFGLRRYPHARVRPPKFATQDEYFVAKHNDQVRQVIRCGAPSMPNPRCVVRYAIDKEISLYYHYPRDALREWKKIDAEVHRIVESFKEQK
jgi:hypothetical protein